MKNKNLKNMLRMKKLLFISLVFLAVLISLSIIIYIGKNEIIRNNEQISQNYFEECINEKFEIIEEIPNLTISFEGGIVEHGSYEEIKGIIKMPEDYCYEKADELYSKNLEIYYNSSLLERLYLNLKSSLAYWYLWIIPLILLVLAFYVRRIKSTRKLSSKID